MRTARIGAELRRSAHLPLVLTTLAILVVLVLVPGHLPSYAPNALVTMRGATPAAYSFAGVAEPVLTLAAALPALVLSADIGDGSRGLILTYHVPTELFAGARLLAALAWCCAWSLLSLVLARLLGLRLPLWTDLAILLPEQIFVFTGVFALTEWTREAGLGAGFAFIALILGYGIRGLPFAHPAAMHLELPDAHNHSLSAALWLNRLALVGLGLMLAGIGTVGMRIHRRRGSYAGS